MPHTILLILLFLLTSFAQAATTRAELLVHFAKDKSILSARAIAQLDSFITTLTIEGDYAFTVHGHTDSDGPLDYNEALADDRAQTVQRYLQEHGADPTLITLARFGERDPLATNGTDNGQALNRRVRITFTRHVFADTEELRQSMLGNSVSRVTIDPGQQQMVRGTAGVEVRFAANAFVDANGDPVDGPVTVALTEALGLEAMLAHQLSTRSGDRLLETAGMLRVQATTADGSPLQLAPGSTMEVSVPVAEKKPGMELFTSENGADWTPVGRSLENPVLADRFVEPRYPYSHEARKFKWPKYREDQAGKPIKPVEPWMIDAPAPPRRESYFGKRQWLPLGRKAAERMAQQRYARAIERHEKAMDAHARKEQRYEAECASYPDRLAAYVVNKEAWTERKRAERAEWDSTVWKAAKEQYRTLYGAEIARTDSLRRAWNEQRRVRLEREAVRMDSLGLADRTSLGTYVFTTTDMDWINCDRFYDVPEEAKSDLYVSASPAGNEQVYIVFTRISSVLATHRENGTHIAPNVPRNEPKVLFAYAVKDGRAQLCVQELRPGTDPKLVFKPSTYAEIRSTLDTLSRRDV